MARKDTRTYAERKARGDAERHRNKGKLFRASDDFWEALEATAAAEGKTQNELFREVMAKHMGKPSLAE